MVSFSSLPIRLTSVGGIAIATLSFVYAVYLALDDGRRDSAEAQSEAKATVQLVSQDLSRLIQGSRDLVLGFSRNAELQNHPEACGAILARLRPSFPQFANMAMIDTERNIVCSVVPTSLRVLPPSPGDDEKVRQLLREDLGVDRLGVGAHLRGGEIHFAYPVTVIVAEKAG